MTEDDIRTCFDCKKGQELYAKYAKSNSIHYHYLPIATYVHCKACKKPRPPFYAANCSEFESK